MIAKFSGWGLKVLAISAEGTLRATLVLDSGFAGDFPGWAGREESADFFDFGSKVAAAAAIARSASKYPVF